MNRADEADEIESFFDRLWPIMRSITGPGVRQTHQILGEVLPLTRHEVESGTEVLDWTVPEEWDVREAYVITPEGDRILDVRENTLHLLNYSAPFRGTVTKAELDAHLYSLPEQPDLIPYRTSYYRKNWGFCLSENQRRALPEGNYEVVIDTDHFPGSLTISEAVLEGESDQEVFFSTYTCHPSLANNELSGPLLTAFLYRRIASWRERNLTYRFVFAPETIGAICYLAMRGEELKERLQAGYIATCVGDSGGFRLKRSKSGSTVADRAAEAVLERRGVEHKVVPFNPSGSDERQYCSLGFNLPVASISRTAYGDYKEYHTSGDNKSLMDFNAMVETLDLYEEVARTNDRNSIVRNRVIHGEPQMSKYGEIYPTVHQGYPGEAAMALKWLIHYADGERDLLGIAEMSGISVDVLAEVAAQGAKMGIFEYAEGEQGRDGAQGQRH